MDSPIIGSRENWKAESKTEASWFGPFTIVSMKHSDAPPSYLVCDSVEGLAEKTGGYLVFEFPEDSNAEFKSEGVAFFSSFEQKNITEAMEPRCLQIYLVDEDATLVKSDIESFADKYRARKWFLSDKDRWFNKFIAPRDHVLQVKDFKALPDTQTEFPIAVRLRSEAEDVIHFATKWEFASPGKFANEHVLVIEAFEENAFLAFGYQKATPDLPEPTRPIEYITPQRVKDSWT